MRILTLISHPKTHLFLIVIDMAALPKDEISKTALLVVDMQEDFCPPVCEFCDQVMIQDTESAF